MRRKNTEATLATLPDYARRVHNIRFIGWVPMGPVYLTRSVYKDGRHSWGVSEPGCSVTYGPGAVNARRAVADAREILKRRVTPPEFATVYPGGARWANGRVEFGHPDGRGGWVPAAA